MICKPDSLFHSMLIDQANRRLVTRSQKWVTWLKAEFRNNPPGATIDCLLYLY